MRRGEAAPTMKDVAREAGVSLGTVSKVFNGIPVGESYRARVEEAAERLGYQLNSYARGLKTNQTRMVALLLPNIAEPNFAALAQELYGALARRDYRMILALTHDEAGEEQRSVRLMEQHCVDGIIGVTRGELPPECGRVPFVHVRGLDAGERPSEEVSLLAERCVELLLWNGAGDAPEPVRVGETTASRHGAQRP